MTNYMILFGLIFEIIGVTILIRDELTPLAARLKQNKTKIESNFSQRLVLRLAKLFGSSNPVDTQGYVVESLSRRFYGFCFLLIGFTVQAITVIILISGT